MKRRSRSRWRPQPQACWAQTAHRHPRQRPPQAVVTAVAVAAQSTLTDATHPCWRCWAWPWPEPPCAAVCARQIAADIREEPHPDQKRDLECHELDSPAPPERIAAAPARRATSTPSPHPAAGLSGGVVACCSGRGMDRAALSGHGAAPRGCGGMAMGSAGCTRAGRVCFSATGAEQPARGAAAVAPTTAQQILSPPSRSAGSGAALGCGARRYRADNNSVCRRPRPGPWLALPVVAAARLGAGRGVAPQRQPLCLHCHPCVV